MFRKAFSNATELLPEVARAIRELEGAPTALRFEPLAGAIPVEWKVFERHGWRSTATVLELVVVPIAAPLPTAVTLSALPGRLARLGRDHGLFDESIALDTGVANLGAHAATRPDRDVPIAGLGVNASGAISAWQQIPSDMLGVILEEADLAERVAAMLRVVADLVPASGSVALAIGLHGLGSVVEGRVADLGRRNSASMAGFGQDKMALVDPRDTVLATALGPGANEIGRELAKRLLFTFRDAFRY